MFETLYEEFTKGLLVLGISLALIIRLAMKNPKRSGGIAEAILGLLFRK
jgi:hypothetical protein